MHGSLQGIFNDATAIQTCLFFTSGQSILSRLRACESVRSAVADTSLSFQDVEDILTYILEHHYEPKKLFSYEYFMCASLIVCAERFGDDFKELSGSLRHLPRSSFPLMHECLDQIR